MSGSHVFISKVILKNFSFRNREEDKSKQKLVYCAELPFGHARCHDIKDFNTRIGAFSLKSEEILKDQFEDSIGALSTMVRKGINLDKRKIDIPAIKKMFAFQCIRDDKPINNYADLYLTNKNLGVKEIDKLKDKLIQQENIRNKNNMKESLTNIFADYRLIIGIDEENRLIGSNYVVSMPSIKTHSNFILLTISPNCTLILTNATVENTMLNYTIPHRILTPQEVNYINTRTIEVGKNRDYGIVISRDKEHLNNYLGKRKS